MLVYGPRTNSASARKKYEHILEIIIEYILRIIYQWFLKYKVSQYTLLSKSLYISNCNSCLLKTYLLCIYGHSLSWILLCSIYELLSFESVNFVWKEEGRQTGEHACLCELILISFIFFKLEFAIHISLIKHFSFQSGQWIKINPTFADQKKKYSSSSATE